jgi:RHS repeat-associated protein
MKHVRNLLLLVAIGTFHCMTAWAQACYTPVQSFQGTYTITGTAQDATCAEGTSCTLNESVTDSVAFPPGFVSCASVTFSDAADSPPQATVNASFSVKCPPPAGPRTVTITNASGGSSYSLLAVNESGNYYYFPSPTANAVLSDPGCGGGGSTTTLHTPFFPAPPGWPITQGLPANVQPLNGPPPFENNDSILAAPTNWDFTYTAQPNYDDDKKCKEKGNSTIDCQNQSLGEDIPIVGAPFYLHYEGSRAPGAGASGIAPADAAILGGWTLSIHHAYDPVSNTLFMGDGDQRNGYQLGTPVAYNNLLLVTSEDGSEVYEFDTSNGHHVQTVRPLTGAVKYVFGYDAAGALVTITDATGNVTKIQRDVSEKPQAILSPFGQTTPLTVDGNGFLSQVTDPLGESSTFVTSSTGLLTSRTDPNGNTFNYTYDTQGRLAKDADPLGGFLSLGRTNAASGFGWTIAETTAMGQTSSYESSYVLPWIQDGTRPETADRVITWPNGLQASETRTAQNGQITNNTGLPDGTSEGHMLGRDPRFGLQSPVLTSETLTQGSLTMNITGSRKAAFTQGNPFSLTSQTDTQAINGRTYTSVFTAATKSLVATSPVKRKMTTILDALERISSMQVGALTPAQFAYDTNGRLSTITQSTRKTTLTYDANGFLATSTDPLNHTTGFTHDAAGRFKTETLPDGRVITYGYDANGHLTSVTPPGQPAHGFSYTAVDEMSTYTPPSVPGTGPTTYTYNLDRELTKITRPDGQTIQFGYDDAGRLSTTTTPAETITYSYDANTGNLSGASIGSGEALTYGYDGPLPISSALTGTVAGTVSRTYNNNFWVTSESINGGNTVNFTYDNDGLVTKAGVMTVRSNSNGLLTGTTLGSATDTRTYNTFGEQTGYTAKYGTITLLNDTFTRDADGRISGKTETIGGKKNSFIYSYDLAGRLTGVKKNGATISTYTYDSNSNRLTATTPVGTVTGTYDAQDRLLTYGNASFTYTANGELATQTVGAQTTTYSYDVLGNLTAVKLPNGTAISYIVDAEQRRVGKQVNGTLTEGFLYDDEHIVAQLGLNNAIVSQFIYGSGSTSPDSMIQGGVTYRVFSDQLGSPRLVVNTSTGVVAEEIDYDEFGNVVNDTNPGFQPFGFAGGLYDQDTKLVRFGARDYNPSVGRWTAKDPILFNGGDTNLYVYVLNDPLNMRDPGGLQGEDCACKQKSLEQAGEKAGQKVVGSGNKGPFSTTANGGSGGTASGPTSVPIPSVSVGDVKISPTGVSTPFISLGGTKGEVKLSVDPDLKKKGCSVKVGGTF